jgi:hypothetical protein
MISNNRLVKTKTAAGGRTTEWRVEPRMNTDGHRLETGNGFSHKDARSTRKKKVY